MIEAIADLRRNPWLLDHIFASLVEDDLTNQVYGQKERDRAKEWFLKTNIAVVMDYRLEPPDAVVVGVGLIDSTESENTVGDLHYQTTESAEAAWSPLSAKFTPTTYTAASGRFVLPAAIADALVVVPGMLVVDRVGGTHAVLSVTDRSNIYLDKNILADFTGSYIKGAQPRLVREIESLAFRENYRVACHAHGEPYLLTWLHSVIVFCLLRYKQAYLEARGFERSIISSGPFAKNEVFGPEKFWTRSITVSGNVRTFWPKLSVDRILSSEVTPLNLSKVGEEAITFIKEDGFTDEDSPFFAQDGLGTSLP